ncbi:type I-F CRISPR-associated helicase Cas3f [Serratia sp. UGAL515B_01]|uniref:type I-F CRISPR-associated helicase Cas3f n=1 Tax=Serratia sp. UGAL515B_01 TaxID=2986763 RepID=UPI0029544747|nr:type I-F CRISPR-associated helicase Cas3f [Serratia sp. UGAL515B_01]WON78432.1 type I-F CRISPR-associated helicase Cas3f [Serratia sp. UGAL515B_01]
MNILLIAQCNKLALTETRRILDQFAERRGDRTWQTAITLEGLNTLRKLLRKTARRNTAVACHWIKGANQTELMWIVGNLRRFNAQGAVPTNVTERDILKSQSENQWHSVETIGLLASIAGLFHDFGKANLLFQSGLRGQGKNFQPYRHEWISLRLFVAWVKDKSDQEWLTELGRIDEQHEELMLSNLLKDSLAPFENPFIRLPPLAKTVAWLIVSHHRLPAYPADGLHKPDLSQIDCWLTQQLTADWNATNHLDAGWTAEEHHNVWAFPHGTPMRSATWQAKAQKLANRALQQTSLTHFGMIDQRFTSHLARLVLMLADHFYSSLPATEGWQDTNYGAYANTDRRTKQCKQKLDEHNIGVGQNALLLGRSLPHIRSTLPAITRHKSFKRRSEQPKFRWQDRAFDLTAAIRERAQQQGFFGINMASTGCGKTFANARIMYALADEKLGCRFSVALGLRTLTLQTGDALREKLGLQEDDLAVLIGSMAVSQLHAIKHEKALPRGTGSASADELFAEHQYVRYDGSLDDGRLSRWLSNAPKLHKLLSAPVLVSTIDHLIGATEGVRGGKQIAPMLRLLTSDLVLDEPDDFDIADLPALCRLVNWAGVLGSRVLLSSATLPPALIQALFNAYRAGRADYQQACGQPDLPVSICCAWFDEHDSVQEDIQATASFKQAHERFVARRVKQLQSTNVLRRAQLIPVNTPSQRESDALNSIAGTLLSSMQQLHTAHHQRHESGKTVSLGVIRMANIDPLVAVAQRLLQTPAPQGWRIHYCVYHSQHPLAMRSHIEQRLDATLTRYHPQALWQIPEINAALDYPEQHHLFVVLATSVAEVGRDHDYDWAIAEPSSMRSLIQLAGRIQRHRQQRCETPNLHILQKNVKALQGHELAYCKPGFESKKYPLNSHDLSEILLPEQYLEINAIPRAQERSPLLAKDNFVDLEHASLRRKLQGKKDERDYYAALWWRTQATWCAEQQRLTPFRNSAPDEQHYLWLEEENDEPRFQFPDTVPGQWKQSAGFSAIELELATGNCCWMAMDYQQVYQKLADELNMELSEVSQKFGEICMRNKEEGIWCYHPLLGVFGALE